MKQLTKYQSRVTRNCFSFLEHLLASFPERVSQGGIIYLGISCDHLIYCTGKTGRIKSYSHKKISFHSLKNYSQKVCLEALEEKKRLPNYELFDDIDKAYENFIEKVEDFVDNVALSKKKRIKVTS